MLQRAVRTTGAAGTTVMVVAGPARRGGARGATAARRRRRGGHGHGDAAGAHRPGRGDAKGGQRSGNRVRPGFSGKASARKGTLERGDREAVGAPEQTGRGTARRDEGWAERRASVPRLAATRATQPVTAAPPAAPPCS